MTDAMKDDRREEQDDVEDDVEEMPDSVIKLQQTVLIASIRIMAALRETNDAPT